VPQIDFASPVVFYPSEYMQHSVMIRQDMDLCKAAIIARHVASSAKSAFALRRAFNASSAAARSASRHPAAAVWVMLVKFDSMVLIEAEIAACAAQRYAER